jgi:hypothetical protein
MLSLAAVYVEPNAPVIDQIQRVAHQASVFSNFGNGNSYMRSPYLRDETIVADDHHAELFFVENGEAVTWGIQSVACSSCADKNLNVYLFDPTQFDDWENNGGTKSTMTWNGKTDSAEASVKLPSGFYWLVFHNVDGASDRSVKWARSVTREDVIRDVLMSTFSALRALKITYTNVVGTYFDGWQHVRRVTESVDALSANCIDGTVMFASVAELLGLEPVLIYKTGHAYVGIRSAPGSSIIWPIETTLVGNLAATPFFAYVAAIGERAKDAKGDPHYQEVDVMTMRGRGVTPLVQQ